MAPFYSKAYLSTQVQTGDRLGLLISLYERGLADVTQAMEAVEAVDSKKRGEMIEKASGVLMALCEALDYTQQGTLAGDLFSLYNFLMRQLLEANRENDLERLQVVKTTLTILLNGWKQIATSAEAAEIREQDIARIEGRAGAEKHARGHRSLVMTA